jgi:hypothetical protein
MKGLPLLGLGAVVLVLGAGAGLGAGAYAARKWAPPPQQVVKLVEQRGASPSETLQTLRVLRDQLASDDEPKSAQKAPETATPEEPPASPEESAQRFRERYRAQVEGIEAEPRDPSWSTQAERAFQQDFSTQEQAFGARLVGIDCRSSGCLGRVEWESYDVALQKFAEIPHAEYATNCAVAIQVGDRPAEPSRPHQATVIFHCREGGG